MMRYCDLSGLNVNFNMAQFNYLPIIKLNPIIKLHIKYCIKIQEHNIITEQNSGPKTVF